MKSLRGLRLAFESVRSRHVSFNGINKIPKARASFMTWGRLWGASEDQAKSSRDSASESRLHETKPSEHGLSQPMRSVMRQLPHPVVVITTLENTRNLTKVDELLDDKLPPPIPRAMTVSSFTSLSINPVPRVTFNITLPSTTYKALAKCGKFNAHILSGDNHGARIADLFTRGNRPPPTTQMSKEMEKTPENANGGDLGVLEGLQSLGVRVIGREKWQKEWKLAGDYGRKVLNTVKSGGYIKDVAIPPAGTLPVLKGRGISHVLKCRYRHLSPPVDDDFDHHAIVIGEVVDVIPGGSRDESGIALAYADRAYRQMGETLLERLERPTAEQVAQTSTEEDTTPKPDTVPTTNIDDQNQS
ncbi:flavin reductase like domain-containing protein [Annulohypoxylon maeteangense]|uniref:flavin reductase like domain-containing protein n=1 Tax=Annulohypoxylon maeteangense TaxID=1927788 RepID=UPI002008C635|nr:flavin reductase like domain-containing protein [Annulohypoxylon maeteangense]KAI0884056.1 flavin reductase like domain-containing protein [Annulohypoxylon maeteangense]